MKTLFFTILALVVGVASGVSADTGVSDSRVSLPEGPGSLEGAGENADVDPNMGNMSYSVGINVPAGFGSVTPQLGLSYSSGNGTSIVGIGWSMSQSTIERSTVRRLPKYETDDFFVANGGEELVYIANPQGATLPAAPCDGGRVYRAWFEGGFTRYTWCKWGIPGGDYWIAESSDGTKSYFGADRNGDVTPAAALARVGKSDSKIFRYHLVDTVDVFGHHMTHSYKKDVDKSDQYAYLDKIEYNFSPNGSTSSLEGGAARYQVHFDYESRDDTMADCKGGFEEIMNQRLTKVSVRVDNTELRRYEFDYFGPESTSWISGISENLGMMTRLETVWQFGRNNKQSEILFSFEYSQGLGAQCVTDDCAKPQVVTVDDAPSVNVASTTLLDINGDSLPDILSTQAGENHKFFLAPDFQTPVLGHGVTNGKVMEDKRKVFDINGDGFTDMTLGDGRYLVNMGAGNWEEDTQSFGDGNNTALDSDSAQFFDYDNDKKIDIVMSPDTESATLYRNTGTSFEQEFGSCDGGFGLDFDADKSFDFTDMNGDGLLDLVDVRAGSLQIRYRVNLGYCNFLDWREMIGGPNIEIEGSPGGSEGAVGYRLEDLNGDGLSDLLKTSVSSGKIEYWLNQNGQVWSAPTATEDYNTGCPDCSSLDSKLLTADMNGNGSSDIVWFQSQSIKYLELFPVRPNLMTRIENGLGQVTEIEYETSVQQQDRDEAEGRIWTHKIPYPMQVVAKISVYEKLTHNLKDVTEYRYHDGFYDGDEKQYRGYEWVDTFAEGDEFAAASKTTSHYDLGAPSDVAFINDTWGYWTEARKAVRIHHQAWNGKLLEQRVYSDLPTSGTENGDGVIDDGEEIQYSATTYAEKPVQLDSVLPDGSSSYNTVSSTDLNGDGKDEAVFFIADVATETVSKEGLSSVDAHRTIGTENLTYDFFGNVTYAVEYGDVDNNMCLAGAAYCDELYSITTFVQPRNTGGRWILGMESQSLSSGLPYGQATMVTGTKTYYDGQPYGSLTLGQVTKLTTKNDKTVTNTGQIVNGEHWITTSKTTYDEHGNVIRTESSPDATGDNWNEVRVREYVYDSDFLVPTQSYVKVNKDNHYLCKTVEYDPIIGKPLRGIGWVYGTEGMASRQCDDTLENLATKFNKEISHFAYDDFGRQCQMWRPGSVVPGGELTCSSSGASEKYEYLLGLPAIGNRDADFSKAAKDAVRSETVSYKRTHADDPDFELVTTECLDGRGRAYQNLQALNDGTGDYQASGFVVYNKTGKEIKVYQPYITPSTKRCASAEPTHDHDTFKFDGLNRPLKVTHPDDTYVYTKYLPLEQESYNENGEMTRQWSDGLGRIYAIQRADIDGQSTGRYVELQYDELGRLLGYIDAQGNQKTQAYDLLDRVLMVQDPNAGGRWFQYNDLGEVVRQGDARNEILENTYDYAGRPVEKWDVSDKAGTAQTWYYDTKQDDCEDKEGVDRCSHIAGKIVRVTYPHASCRDGQCATVFGYTTRGMTQYVANYLPESGDFRFESKSDYDHANRLTKATYPDGRSMDFIYDGAGRFINMILEGDTTNPLVSIRYNERGLARDKTYSNGVVDSYEYDNRLRLQAHDTVKGTEKYQAYRYSRDKVGNILAIGDESIHNDFWKGSYQYDGWNRLTKATTGSDDKVEDYEYDNIDNIVKRGDLDYTYAAGKPNAVKSVGDLSYDYDPAGNVIKRGEMDLVWDAWGRLTEANEGGETKGRFVYGTGPQRVLKIEPHLSGWSHMISPAFEVRNGVAVLYPRLGRSRIARIENPDFAKNILDDKDGDGKIRVNDAWLQYASVQGFDVSTE